MIASYSIWPFPVDFNRFRDSLRRISNNTEACLQNFESISD